MRSHRTRLLAAGPFAALPLAALLLAGLLAGCAGVDTVENAATVSPPVSPPPVPASPAQSAGGFNAIPDVIQRTEPSIVTVRTGEGLGSGVVYKDGGVVVTNAHVLGDAKRVELTLADGSRVSAQVTAIDLVTDLAVLRAERTNLPAARFEPALPRVGELVVALGSPLGFANSATAGIVSGLGREIPDSARTSRSLVDLIQTDAAISPGNSGGALVNTAGKIVGINEAYIPPGTGAVAIGFAIPAATVTDTVDELLADGTASHPFLGIVPGRITPELAKALGVGASEGVLVRDLTPNGPAAKAGVQRGDVITALGGNRTRTVEEFLGALRRFEPGQQAKLDLRRQGRSQTVTVTMGELKS